MVRGLRLDSGKGLARTPLPSLCGSGLPWSASKIRPDYFLQAPERSRSPSRHGFDGFLLRCVSCKRFGPHLGPVRAPSGRTKTSKSIEPLANLAFSAFLNFAHFGGPLEGFLGPSWGTFWAEISSSGRLQRSKIPLGLFFPLQRPAELYFSGLGTFSGPPETLFGSPRRALGLSGPILKHFRHHFGAFPAPFWSLSGDRRRDAKPQLTTPPSSFALAKTRLEPPTGAPSLGQLQGTATK